MTDKYDGHTDYEWVYKVIDGKHVVGMKGNTDTIHDAHAVINTFGPHPRAIAEAQANARLIADAPDLLAENKRLREALSDAEAQIRFFQEDLVAANEIIKALATHEEQEKTDE